MTSVALDRVWLNDALDLSDSISFFTADRKDGRQRQGRFGTYAGGRVRLTTTPTRTRTLPLRAVDLTTTQVEWLDAHTGSLLLLRDKKGRRVWGAFLAVEEIDYPAQTGQDIALTFTQLSYDESV